MRKLTRFDDLERARTVQEALRADDIASELRSGPDHVHALWILSEEQLPAARQLLEEYLADPTAPRFASAQSTVRAKSTPPPPPPAPRPRARAPRARQPFAARVSSAPVTHVIVAASLLATLWSELGASHDAVRLLSIASYRYDDGLLRWPGYQELLHGQLWRLFTPIFLHFGVFHLLFNAFWMLDLGAAVERFQGSLRFVAFVSFCAAASNLAQLELGGTPNFGGLSGIVYALVGYVWARGRFDPLAGIGVPPQLVRFFVVWMLLGFTGLLDRLVGPMANYCHGGGFVSGALYGYFAARHATRHLRG